MNKYGPEYDLKKAQFIFEAVKRYVACIVTDENHKEQLAENIMFSADVLEDCIRSVEYYAEKMVKDNEV